MTGHVIRSGEYVIMVQDQDSLGGGFHPRDAFSEMMSDVNVWDHVLSPAVINEMSKSCLSEEGNVYKW